jgi:photosystem II stability/assembly factor-like uncharacterized protein
MCFRDGVVWIAADTLYKSLDTGLTWTAVNNIIGSVHDVDFIDKRHGIISSASETYLTSDGGVTLPPLGFGVGAYSGCFGKDSLTIGLAEIYGPGPLAVSTDGGKTWIHHATTGQGFCVRRSSALTMNSTLFFYQGSQATGGSLTWTNDQGNTWSFGSSSIDWDSYSFAPDSCDPNRIYVSHEDAAKPTDVFSKIYLTADLGNTWKAVVSNREPYFSGSVAVGKEAVYCPTVANGIFRSLDKGMTWISIGGPSVTWDTRLISAINDNIIIAADTLGNIWRTNNSGGDSVTLQPGLGTLTLSTHSVFSTDTLACGDSATGTIITQSFGCVPPFVASAQIVGGDSLSYRLISIGAGSITVLFEPADLGAHQSKLILTLGDGTTDTVALGGNSIGGNNPLTMSTADQKTDTIGGTVNVPIQFNGLLGVENVDVVMHFTGDVVYDSSVDLLGGKIDVAGEEWQGRSKLHLASVRSGVVAGYARFNVFSDSSSKPVVTFDSVQIQAAGCKYQMPPPVSSTITPLQGCGTQLISELMTTGHVTLSIHPNPSSGEVLLSSSADLDDATVEIYDMLGTERSQTALTLKANVTAQLSLPQSDGMYTIRVRSAAGVFSSRVIVQR